MIWWVYLLAIVFLGTVWNLSFRYLTYRSIERELKSYPWINASMEEYLQKCYHLVADRYPMLRHCWAKRFWRSLFYRNLWNLKGKGLPCHIYNVLFNHCMSMRLPKKDIRLRYVADLKQKVFIHYYSQLKVGGKWMDVDVWGKYRGVPFGSTINSPGWKR